MAYEAESIAKLEQAEERATSAKPGSAEQLSERSTVRLPTASAEAGHRCDFITAVQGFRRSHASAAPFPVELSAADIQAALDHHRRVEPPPIGLSGSQRLWLSLFNVCMLQDLKETAALQALITDFLEPFSALRRQIIQNTLLGCPPAKNANFASVSERTIDSTLDTAIDLLTKCLSQDA